MSEQPRPVDHTHACPTCHRDAPCTGTTCRDVTARECATCSHCKGW